MNLKEIKRQIEDIVKTYGITHSDYNEKRIDGEVKFVDLHIRFKVEKMEKDKKSLDLFA